MGQFRFLLSLLFILTLSRTCSCEKKSIWDWLSLLFNSGETSYEPTETLKISGDVAAKFSMDALNDENGIERLKNARKKLVGSNSCWHDAYQGIFAAHACSEIVIDENDKRKRFAWDLSNCFLNESGRNTFPTCRVGSPMKACLGKLDNNSFRTYSQFYLETNSICNQLQSSIFRRQTERLVNDLVKSSDYAEEKLETIAEKSEKLLQSSKDIHESLTSIDQQTQQVALVTKNASDHIGDIVKQSQAVLEQSEKIAASQLEFQKGQDKMKEKLEEEMAMLHESYHSLGKGIYSLQDETIEIEKKISIVGDTMSTKMNKLQSKADDIENVAGISLERQKELLQGQSEALNGLQSLTKSFSQALEESRSTFMDVLQKFAKFGSEQHEQQEELLRKTEHIQRASNSILSAQEAFEQKQATMFVVLDKLFALLNTILLESRLFKTFIVYVISMFIIFMFTSTKQTYTVRLKLYIGLWIAFMIEFSIRFSINGLEQQTCIVTIVRILYVLIASVHILHSFFTYRDYEKLNYIMLSNLAEEVRSLRKNVELSCESDDELEWSSWVDIDIPDGVENLKDSNHLQEEIGDNSNTIPSVTGRYNLRSRS